MKPHYRHYIIDYRDKPINFIQRNWVLLVILAAVVIVGAKSCDSNLPDYQYHIQSNQK